MTTVWLWLDGFKHHSLAIGGFMLCVMLSLGMPKHPKWPKSHWEK